MAHPFHLLLAVLFISSKLAMATYYNVMDFGARPDGRTDSAKPFLAAWEAACGSNHWATFHVPQGTFLVSQALFSGPCRSGPTKIYIDGTIVAPAGYSDATTWIMFQYVQGFFMYGGTFDGRGQALWSCKNAGRRSCATGATSLYIAQCKDVVVRGVTLMNSETFQMSIYDSTGVRVEGVNIVAPRDSPNTDGIHVQLSTFVSITRSTMATGDDCISLGPGSMHVAIEYIKCGPGHGISIGSLGGWPEEPGVENITVRSVVFSGTQNGLRIKTWGKPYRGFVKNVKFEHIVMKNVQNPIFIDQNYCPRRINCPGQSSGVKISQVLFDDVQGTSATAVAVRIDCSSSNHCTGITLQDIRLTSTSKEPARSYCKNVKGTTSGAISPGGCL